MEDVLKRVHPATPRIKGRVGEAEAGQGHDGKFFAEISAWDLAGTTQIGPAVILGPFDSEEAATAELKRATQIMSEAVEQAMTGSVQGNYIDMTAGGATRKWNDEH